MPVPGREELLAALRRNAPRETPAPDLSRLGVKFADPLEQYAISLNGVGGTCLRAADLPSAEQALAALPAYREAKRVVTLVPGVGQGNVDLASLSSPHLLEGLDLAILPGELAVAENGAVWVDASRLHHRAVFVITQHLVLVVTPPTSSTTCTRLTPAWRSGPSATASSSPDRRRPPTSSRRSSSVRRGRGAARSC